MSRLVFVCLLAVGGAFAHLACSPSPGAATQGIAAPAKPAPVPAPPAAPGGSRAEGENYEIALEPPGAVRAGEAATARVVVKSRGPYHVNREYPMAFRPDAGATARFDGDTVSLREGAEGTPCRDFPGESCTVSAPLRFTAAASGETRLAGTVAFSVCNPERCLIEKVALSAAVAAR
jgi:hypothetical protein